MIKVETGIGLKKKKKAHDKKFTALREKYGKRCYVFLVNYNLINSYKRHQLLMLLRLQIKEFVESQFSNKKNITIVQNLDLAND